MSSAVRAYHSTLFSAKDMSDCTIELLCGGNEDEALPPAKKKRKPNSGKQDAGERNTFPAHLFIVCPGSAYFGAQADRWAKEQNGKPVLRVRLDTEDDLPHAKAAVQYMYTGECKAASAEDLLRLRRMATFMQVEGCMEACDAALTALLSPSVQQGPQIPNAPSEPRAPVLSLLAQLFACRHLLPEAAEDRAAGALISRILATCRKELSQYNSDAKATFGPVSLGDLLIWAFPSAPDVLNDPESLQAAQALPAPMLEALLGHDSFATDSEDSVLLLLAYWVQANPTAIRAVLAQLCRLIRPLRLTDGFRCALLPELPWFPIKPEEHRFLCTYAATPPARRARLACCNFQFGCCQSPWYTDAPRPRAVHPAGGRCYDWYLTRQQLAEMLRSNDWCRRLHATLIVAGQTSREQGREQPRERERQGFVADGLMWRVRLQHVRDTTGFDLTLDCSLPPPFRPLAAQAGWLHLTGHPGPCRLAVWRARATDGGGGGGGQDRERLIVQASEVDGPIVCVSLGAPEQAAVASGEQPAGQEQQQQQRSESRPGDEGALLAAWAPYIVDGRMSGTLAWD